MDYDFYYINQNNGEQVDEVGEPVVCKIFGCGRHLSHQEQLFGDLCVHCQVARISGDCGSKTAPTVQKQAVSWELPKPYTKQKKGKIQAQIAPTRAAKLIARQKTPPQPLQRPPAAYSNHTPYGRADELRAAERTLNALG